MTCKDKSHREARHQAALILSLGMFALLASNQCAAETRTWTGAGNDRQWSTASNWSPSGVPAAGDVVTVGSGASVTCSVATAQMSSFTLSGGTLIFKEPSQCLVANAVAKLCADAVTIQNGARVTHVRQEEDYAAWVADGKGEWKIDGRVNISCGTLTLDATSSITGDGLGYYCHSSVKSCMCGPNSLGTYGNGGHGGYGYFVCPQYADYTSVACAPHDDPIHPVMPGTSGSQGDTAASPGNAGGGAIRIAATGAVTIEGTVSANAQVSGGNSRYAGAGGSVWISCGTVSGGGVVRANGSMNNGNGFANRCGGGGCVAIHYDATAQAALAVPDLRISGGVDFYSNVRGLGDVGTVYLTDTRFLRETFNTTRGVTGGSLICGSWSGWSPASLTLDNVWIRFPSGACKAWHLTGDVAVSGLSGRLDFGGEKFFMIQRGITPLVSTQTVNVVVDGSVTLSNKGRLSVFAAETNGLAETWATLDVKGDLSIAANSVLELFSHPTNGASCHVTCANLTVAASGAISAGAHGFGGGINGKDMKSYGPGGVQSGSGGSHGGFSHAASPYGDCKRPLLPGSGGARGDNSQNGSPGGGVVYITASGACELNGSLDASASGQLGNSSGTGSGGSVFVTAKTFTGTGSVTANGGNGQQDANAGAGGRIALVCTDAAAQAALASPAVYTFDTRTYGGSSGVRVQTSDFGTLYLSDMKMARDSLEANKILHCQLYSGDGSAFEAGDLALKDTFVRFMGSSSVSANSVSLNGAWLEVGGDAPYWRLSVKRPYRKDRGIDFAVAGDVTLTNKSLFTVRGGITNGNVGVVNYDLAKTNALNTYSRGLALSGTVTIGGTLTICTNAWVCPESHPYDGGSVRMTVGSLDIHTGGGIDASARGWCSTQDDGIAAGRGPGGGTGQSKAAGYGGKADTGRVYGSAVLPLLPGSGAGSNIYSHNTSGAGGGLVWLTVRRTAKVCGSILANGQTTSGTWASGGSGGGIYLQVPHLTCSTNALLSAEGGGCNMGAADGRRGGGGRIAVYTKDGTVPSALRFSVKYGQTAHANTPAGENGTVYVGKISRVVSFVFK